MGVSRCGGLRRLREPGLFAAIEAKAKRLIDGIAAAAAQAGVPVFPTQVGTLGCVFFTDRPVTSYDDATTSDTARFARYFHGLLARGVAIAPSQYEALFLSAAHTDADVDRTVAAAAAALRAAA